MTSYYYQPEPVSIRAALICLGFFGMIMGFFVLSSTSAEAQSHHIKAGDEIRIIHNDVALKVRWVELQDSRCPVGVQCITAGQAALKLNLQRDGEGEDAAREVTLVLSADDRRPSTRDRVAVDSWNLRLVSVDPYPDANKRVAAEEKSAKLVLEPTDSDS